MEISISNKNDLQELDNLQKSCFGVLERQDFSFILENPNYIVLHGRVDGILVCFISATISFDQSDVLQVCVDSGYRNKGLAKELLAHFENIMKEKGVKELFLEVNENNLPATLLYTGSGFITLCKREKYYGEDSAIVMRKIL